MSNDPRDQDPPQYYRPGPSTGNYPQYPQNPFPNGGWTPGAVPQPAQPQPTYPAVPNQAQWHPPAGTGTGPARQQLPRPRQVVTALILLVLSALPFVLIGLGSMFTPIDAGSMNEALDQAGIPRAELDTALAQSGMTLDQLVSVARVMGAVFLILALAYVALAVVAFLGRPGARVTLTILTVLYGLPLLLMLVSLPAFGVLVLALAAGGVALLYSRPASDWYASRRAGTAR